MNLYDVNSFITAVMIACSALVAMSLKSASEIYAIMMAFAVARRILPEYMGTSTGGVSSAAVNAAFVAAAGVSVAALVVALVVALALRAVTCSRSSGWPAISPRDDENAAESVKLFAGVIAGQSAAMVSFGACAVRLARDIAGLRLTACFVQSLVQFCRPVAWGCCALTAAANNTL